MRSLLAVSMASKGHLINLAGEKNEVVAFQPIIEGPGQRYTLESTPLKGSADVAIPLKDIQLFREVGVNMKDDGAPGEKQKTATGFGSGQHWSHDPAA